MLISLLALLAMTVSAGIRAALGEAPIMLEGPSTLELALVGGGVFVVYAVASRRLRRRRSSARSIAVERQLAAATQDAPADQPSRGAA